MMQATEAHLLALLAIRTHLAVASHCIYSPYHHTRAWPGLALVGLVVGISCWSCRARGSPSSRLMSPA